MKERVTAVVPAAGLGKRFGSGTNKAFQTLGGKYLVEWVLEILESVEEISEIIPVFKREEMDEGQNLVERLKISKVKRVAPGGKERQDSVFNGLSLIDKKTGIVLIHDGARPLIEKNVIKESIRRLKGCDGVIVGVPVKDTIKEVRSTGEEIIVKKTPKRETLWAVQTPQAFKYSPLMKAYKKAMSGRFYSTDDSAIVERYGGKVKMILGSYRNIKITTPEDLEIAELFLERIQKEKNK